MNDEKKSESTHGHLFKVDRARTTESHVQNMEAFLTFSINMLGSPN